MRKLFIIIAIIWSVTIAVNLWLKSIPSCTYEYWANGNTKKFEQACQALKDKNKLDRDAQEKIVQEAKKQQAVYKAKNDEVRVMQDKVATEINAIRQQDTYAFRKAE